jgi:4-hydroxybenzoate polyprenyltransferase
LQQYALLMRLHKPIGWLLLLWPTWWALWLAAKGVPRISTLIIFSCGVVVMRSAGCVINDYADRWLDPHVARTKDRPIASGKVSPREALILFSGLLLLAFLLVLLTDPLTIKLALVGAALAAIYPFMKRVTHLAQIWLGAAFGWAVPMAFSAQLGELTPICWLLFFANVLWSTGYDTIYAMVDRADDLTMGSRSTAILFGDLDRVIIGVIQYSFLLAMVLVGIRAELGIWYYAGLSIAALMVVYQLWLIRSRDTANCFKAFLNNQWLGLVIFIGISAHYWLNQAA